jgi:hypothetical protein
MNRPQALNDLLSPITWHPSTSIAYRKNYVLERRHSVNVVRPFLTRSEKKRADKWLEDEKHEGLWE